MHPINKKNFGAGKVKVFFHDGAALATGYIVKQTGLTKYVVSNGTVTKTLALAPTAALGDILTGVQAIDVDHTVAMIAGLCTITVTVGGNDLYVKKLNSKTALLVTGATVAWTLGAPTAAAGPIAAVYAISK